MQVEADVNEVKGFGPQPNRWKCPTGGDVSAVQARDINSLTASPTLCDSISSACFALLSCFRFPYVSPLLDLMLSLQLLPPPALKAPLVSDPISWTEETA